MLEERWLDGDASGGGMAFSSSVSGGEDTVARGGALGDEDGGGLEDMLWGNVMGFFWPVGAVVWLLREEGLWSKRRQIAVCTGVLVNVAIGVMRVAG